jgi:hypothetical protein
MGKKKIKAQKLEDALFEALGVLLEGLNLKMSLLPPRGEVCSLCAVAHRQHDISDQSAWGPLIKGEESKDEPEVLGPYTIRTEDRCTHCDGVEEVYPDPERGVNTCISCAETAWEHTYNKFHAGEYGRNEVKFVKSRKVSDSK